MFEPTLTNVISLAVVSVLVCVTFVLIVLRSRGKDRRISNRFEVNCEVEFTANGIHYRGMTQDLSLNGLSIKTEHQLGPATMLDIVIGLPGNKTSKLKGQVVRTIQGGVGVKIIENNSDYMRYYKHLQKMG
ncbi:MAG TPA: PilZ domain-containing protein [Thermodesulfovibrionales bacterium]|nr:PilZ domain-containing protein [Thermodesulfovibrionales bacterium]